MHLTVQQWAFAAASAAVFWLQVYATPVGAHVQNESARAPLGTTSPQQRKNMSEIEADIRTIVGGHFSPDSLSPEVYKAISARATRAAAAYLDVFDAMFLGEHFDAREQSRLFLPSFLKLVRESAPDRTRRSVARLLKLYDAVMVVYDDARDKAMLFKTLPDETGWMLERLEMRRKELRLLL
jgi:hypothetical protein